MAIFQVLLAVFLSVAVVSAGYVPSDCLRCICHVESGCTTNVSCGDGGASCGPYQIQKAYWIDATMYGGSLNGEWKNCYPYMSCSEKAVHAYMKRYATASRLGHNPTCQDFARIHNGGPNGHLISATIGYWNKVNRCLGN